MLNTKIEERNGVYIGYVGHVKPSTDDVNYIYDDAIEHAQLAKKTLVGIYISRSEYHDTAAVIFDFGNDDRLLKHFNL